MAREEHDREDLLREATALVERAELRVEREPETVTIGFRRDGGASIYFGGDPVYQFNPSNELRRAFIDGKLLKAERGKLVELTRVRTSAATELVARSLTAEDETTLLDVMGSRLSGLQQALDGNRFQIVGQVPPDADVIGRIRSSIERLQHIRRVAKSPRAGG